MPDFYDDKSEHVLPFVLERMKIHEQQHAGNVCPPPFFLGINGVQGIGKTTLVSILRTTFSQPPHNLPTAVISIDDLYLPHEAQASLARSHPTNPLIQHRGQPSTHDLQLGSELFSALVQRRAAKVPVYDKSRFQGEGDRVDESEWETVNGPGQPAIRLVMFEGWCVGFRARGRQEVQSEWEAARSRAMDGQSGWRRSKYKGRLAENELENLMFVDDELRRYDILTDRLDAIVHVNAEDIYFVYDWRLDQEVALRAKKGSGMTDEQVKIFVDGYYPSYELYTDKLCNSAFPGEEGRKLVLTVGRDRKILTTKRT